MKKSLFALIAFPVLVGTQAVPVLWSVRFPEIYQGPDELSVHTVVSGGLERTYRVYCPPKLAGGDQAPVVVCFHGAGASAQFVIDHYGVLEEAKSRGWIAVFPEGTGLLSGTGAFGLQTWNAGDCCGYAKLNDIDDVGFFEDLLLDLSSEYPANLDQVCATGMSNGAMMTYRLACERPDLLAAVAPVAGSLESDLPTAPVPILAIFGLLDPIVPLEGGVGAGAPNISYTSQASSLSAFLEINQFSGVQLVFNDPTAMAWIAPGKEDGATTAYYLALDGGHTWPGQSNLAIDSVHTTYPAPLLMFDFWESELGL